MKHVFACAMALASLPGAPAAHAGEAQPLRFILIGDSTMARGSGYGDAFCARVAVEDTCINLARAGRSSASFRKEGRWEEVLGLLRAGGAYRATYVLIQFGHNDQPGKPGHSTDLATEFPANLARYAEEAKAAGGKPVLITPLTRRNFVNGVLDNNLRPWAAAALTVASRQDVPALDLNRDSYAAVQAMGQDAADTLAVAPRPADYVAPATLPGTLAAPDAPPPPRHTATQSAFDRTHLGTHGADYFSRMLRDELIATLPELGAHVRP